MPRSCVTMEHHFALAKSDPTYAGNRRRLESFSATRRIARVGVARIPVVVHVLWKDDHQNISDDQIASQLAVLNADFRARNADVAKVPTPFAGLVGDAQLEFVLAVRDPDGSPTTGITRTRTSLPAFDSTAADLTLDLDQKIKFDGTGRSAWPADRYLNLWVCELGGGLLGYAQFPGGPPATDGVVIGHRCFGTTGTATSPFHLGRTATHEIGHFFNLLHIWGDDGGGCDAGDNVGDTPNQAGSNTDKPTFPCVSCGNGPHGDLFMNYMDYVDDEAMFLFSKGQVQRMNAALAGARASLLRSDALDPVTNVEVRQGGGLLKAAELRSLVLTPTSTEAVFDGVSWIR